MAKEALVLMFHHRILKTFVPTPKEKLPEGKEIQTVETPPNVREERGDKKSRKFVLAAGVSTATERNGPKRRPK